MEVNKTPTVKIEIKERKELKSYIIPNEDLGANVPGLSPGAYTFLEGGYANGYVAIPPGHPCYNKHYDEIDVEVHGGLTFSHDANSLIVLGRHPEVLTEDFKDYWIVGFDTRHYEDSRDRWPKEAVEKETLRLKEQLEGMW